MKELDFNCSISLQVTGEEAYEAITQLSAWWAKHVEGDTKTQDSIFKVSFGETWSRIKITEAVPRKKIVWEVLDCHLPIFKNPKDWEHTSMSWEITTENESTQITFTHIGLVPGKECYTDCKGGWSFFITESLFKLITEGKGIPGVGIRSTITSGVMTYKGTLFFKNDPLPQISEGSIIIDVKEIRGEHVVSAFSVEKLEGQEFDRQKLRGKHYLIIEDAPVFGNITPFEDILNSIK
jgi:hypothetical protein